MRTLLKLRGMALPASRHGFTLVELVMVIAITGILAVAVVPRLFDVQTYRDRAFRDGVLAALRFAQKSAVAQRRMVCVAFTQNAIRLHVSSVAGAACVPGGGANTIALAAPTGGDYSLTGEGDARFTATPGNFGFNGLGQPVSTTNALLTAAVTIPVLRRADIVVQPETGHVQ